MSFWSREAANAQCHDSSNLVLVVKAFMYGDQLSDYCFIYVFLQADPDLGSVSMIDKANKELVEVAQRGEPSVLRERLFEGLVAKNRMSEVKEEQATRCPVVNSILTVLLDESSSITYRITAYIMRFRKIVVRKRRLEVRYRPRRSKLPKLVG